MKVQVRKNVFETNSSSTHALTMYKQDEWNAFKNGELFMWKYDDNLYTRDELKKFYENDIKRGYCSKETDFQYWINEECFDCNAYEEEYEVLTGKAPDSEYIAVSIYGYE